MHTTQYLIDNFIEEYKRSHVICEDTAIKNIKQFVAAEDKYGKPFYEFNKDETLAIFKEFHSKSVRTLHNKLLVVKMFARWLNKPSEVFEGINKYDLLDCISKQKKANAIIDKRDFDNIVRGLRNDVDRAIFLLLWNGFKGKKFCELTFINNHQLDVENLCVNTVTGKVIQIDRDLYDILKKAFAEDYLESYNNSSFGTSVMGEGQVYKMRGHTRTAHNDINSNSDVNARYIYLKHRFDLIKPFYGISHMNPESICTSGLVHKIKENMHNNNMTYEQYIHTLECQKLANQYDISDRLYVQKLKDKTKSFIE